MGFRRLCASYWTKLLVLVAAALVCGSSQMAAPRANRITLRRHHDPRRFFRQRNQTVSDSFNWSGYAVTGATGSVTNVTSSWIVPSISSCSTSPDGFASFWLGIDGWTSSTVEQIGTDSDCASLLGKKNTPTYYAWYEFYPAGSVLIGDYNRLGVCISDCVQPGDVMSAAVFTVGNVLKGSPAQRFTVNITDQTQGWTFSATSAVPGAQESSAEWIAEAPSGCPTLSRICTLAAFDPVSYGVQSTGILNTSSATISGQTGLIGSFGGSVQEAVMVSYPAGAVTMAQPGDLGSGDDSGSFSVNWENAGP